MNVGTGAAKPTAVLTQAIQASIAIPAASAATSQHRIVIDGEYFRTCAANKEWVSTCIANQDFLRQCMEQRERLQVFLPNPELDDGSRDSTAAKSTHCGEISTSMDEDFPPLPSGLDCQHNEQRGPVIGRKNEGAWQTAGSKRKHSDIGEEQRESSEGRIQRPPMQTVVLRPVCKRKVEEFSTKELRAAIEKIGVKHVDEFTVHRHEKANTIAITTRNSFLASKFLQIKEIPNAQLGPQAVQPYKALGSNEVRGVIYLHSPHDEPETLVRELTCNTHKIVTARALGAKKKTILVSFEGRTLPRHVRYVFEVYRVAEYRPRPLVCFGCHQIGHKADVCPMKIKRCGSCGHEHGEVEDCQKSPRCVNCEGAHVATSNECPKRKIPPRHNSRNRQKTWTAPRGDASSQFSQTVLTTQSSQPILASPDTSWVSTLKMQQGPTDPARPLIPIASTAATNTQQWRPGQQSPTSQPSAIPPKDPLDWEARFAALNQRVEQGFAAVHSNTNRIERLESLAIEILAKVNSIGEKFDRYLDPKYGR